jgi:hypothetical protein
MPGKPPVMRCASIGPAVERPVVRGEALHHVQVAAEKEKQDRSAGQQPVPNHLKLPVERVVLFGEPRQFVEHDDARPIRQRAGKKAQHVAPATARWCGGQKRMVVRKVRLRQRGEKLRGRLGDRGAFDRGEVEVGQAGAIAEFLDQARFPDLATAADRDRDPGAGLSDVVDTFRQKGQLGVAADEHGSAPEVDSI